MDSLLVVKVLTILEVSYPQEISCIEITKVLKNDIKDENLLRKYLNNEIKQVINYLDESGKIELGNHFQGLKNLSKNVLLGNETIKINHKGIDYLTELRILNQKERIELTQIKSNKSMANTTFVIALATILNLMIIFMEFNYEISKNFGYFETFIMFIGFLLIFIPLILYLFKNMLENK